MFCPKCGLNNEDDARFCFDCGERLDAPGPQTPPGTGPDWRNINIPPAVPPAIHNVPAPIAPPPAPMAYQPPVTQMPAQVIIGAPARQSALGGIFILLSVFAL